jgi:hypothetical protein
LGIASCGTDDAPRTISDYLPEVIDGTTLTRSGEVRLFAGPDLWEYINGDAEIYHQYAFVEVATADYRSGDVELIADIYRFADYESAYGLFTAIRPDESEPLALGTASIVSETSLDCVIGRHLLHITTFASSEETLATMQMAARTLVSSLPGTALRPTTFARFPEEGRLPARDQIYAGSFLGRRYLTRVFTQDYSQGTDTVTLFLSPDSAEEKFRLWSEELAASTQDSTLSDFPFTNGLAMTHTDSFRGNVVVGVVGDYLVGIIGYSPLYRDFFVEWLRSLETPTPDGT